MSGQPAKIKAQFIPPPIDGLNLISPPSMAKTTEARQLDNYYIYDWGIRERGAVVPLSTPDGNAVTSMYSFTNSAYQAVLIETTANLYRLSALNTSPILDLLYNKRGLCFGQYNNHVYIPDYTGDIGSYNLSTDAFSSTSFTGASGPVTSAFAFKNRMYFVGRFTSVVWYGGVAAVTGAFESSFDFAQIFQKGKIICWGCSWPYNQGITTEELFVVGNEAGEVLLYSGSWPGSSDWTLVGRTEIPIPIGPNYGSGQYYPMVTPVKLGQDILINTTRGIISLQKIFAGRSDDASYYSVSRNIGPVLVGVNGAKSAVYPFVYFAGGTNSTSDPGSIYALNYERGAWSKFPNITSTSISQIVCTGAPKAAQFFAPYNTYLVIASSGGQLLVLNEGATTQMASGSYVYKSPFFDFGSPVQKRIQTTRVHGRDVGGTTLLSHTLSIQSDFSDATPASFSTGSLAPGDSDYHQIEIATSGLGSWVSLDYTKTAAGANINELAGTQVFYEEGGQY